MRLAMLTAMGLLLPASALASGLVLSPTSFTVNATPNVSDQPGTVLGEACSGAKCSYAMASAFYLSGEPRLSGSVSDLTAGAPEVFIYDEVMFDFEIVGPDSASEAPILLTASGSASGTGSGGAIKSLITLGRYFQGVCAGTEFGPCGQSSFQGIYQAGLFYTNVEYQVTYRITGEAGGQGVDTGAFSASLDPDISIDPTWLGDNPGYSLALSPSPPAPEPSAWVLMILGVGALGAALRNRRRGSASLTWLQAR
jgi:hypothetical protein